MPEDAEKSIKSQLPEISNIGHNDCGVLAAYYCAHALGALLEYPATLDEMRGAVGKREENGTTTGSIVRFLKDHGLEVLYYTDVDWRAIATLPDDQLQQICERMNASMPPSNPALANMMQPEAVRASAQYLAGNSDLMKSWEGAPILEVMGKALEKDYLIILLVDASHYVVLTGINDERAIIYDPNDATDLRNVSLKGLLDHWSLQNGSILPNGEVLSLREGIIVAKP